MLSKRQRTDSAKTSLIAFGHIISEMIPVLVKARYVLWG